MLREIRVAAGDRPVWIGSGFNPDDAAKLVLHIDAAIVGTWLKQGGDVRRPIDPKRVRELVDRCGELTG